MIEIRLDGQNAAVTGAGSGIGRTIAAMLAAAGANIIILDRVASAAQETAAQIMAAGGNAFPMALDVGDNISVKAGFTNIAARLGGLDILVNNAGIYPMAAFDALPDATWDAVFAVNLRGAFNCMREARRLMQSGGRIVNISSIDSLRPSAPGLAHYGASKAALNALTRSAAVEFGPHGIRVNALLPGVIMTEGTAVTSAEMRELWIGRTPSRRLGTPQDIAGAALFLVSDLAAFVQGTTLVADGGITING